MILLNMCTKYIRAFKEIFNLVIIIITHLYLLFIVMKPQKMVDFIGMMWYNIFRSRIFNKN